MSRGQSSLEYVLMLSGVLMVVVLATVLIRGTGSQAGNDVAWKSCKTELARNESCYAAGSWDPTGNVHQDWARSCESYKANYPTDMVDKTSVGCTGNADKEYVMTGGKNYYCCGLSPSG